MSLHVILSIDYEVYGDGSGSFEDLILRPTDQLLELFDEFGFKLTIMAEVAELYAIKHSEFHHAISSQIESQLQRAKRAGHDVQLHLHPAWFNARLQDGVWQLDFAEYGLPYLPEEKIRHYVECGKAYLEELLTTVDPGYRCLAFRAGNWLIQPERTVLDTLCEHGIAIDSSVFDGGRSKVGRYEIDYTDAHHCMLPWRASPDNICRRDDAGRITEIPIYARRTNILGMLTWKRISKQLRLRRGMKNRSSGMEIGRRSGSLLNWTYPKKFDFTRMTFHELRDYTRAALRLAAGLAVPSPCVAIGHTTDVGDLTYLRTYFDWIKQQDNVNINTFQGYHDL
jgi:hypothetical protein